MARGSISPHHSSDPAPAPTASFPHTLVEYRKDGAISKMRCHKGNIPVLPQTKLCPHCPAKFTRTTHLNRHLRTHTGERQHRCETCDAQFTRSDLLTRHKKTCGDPSHAGRTRRRSCQACADSKVKCDLQQPCSKCQARGKECVFVTRSFRSSATSKARPLTTVTITKHISDSVVADTAVSSPQSTTLPPISSNPTLPTSPKPDVPSDHLDHMSFSWTSTTMHLAKESVDEPDVRGSHSIGLSPSPPESLSSTSDLESPAASGSAPIQNPLNSIYANDDLEPFFSMFSTDDSATFGHENTQKDMSLPSSATPSPVLSADDGLSYVSQGGMLPHGIQHHLQQSGSLFYGQSSNEQVYIPTEHSEHRQHFVPGNYIPTYTLPINVQQQGSSEEQYYHVMNSFTHPRSRARPGNPYQGYESMRRATHEGCEGTYDNQLRHQYTSSRNIGNEYGRDGEKVCRHLGTLYPLRLGISTPENCWSAQLETERAGAVALVQQHTNNDDQVYRSYRSEAFVDPFLWSESYVMRRQVAGIELA